jgi:hypothetical protein
MCQASDRKRLRRGETDAGPDEDGRAWQVIGTTRSSEQIRHEVEDGGEYWSARELAKVLGHAQWRTFALVIAQALTACEHSGQVMADHFAETSNMVTLGSSG